MADVLTGSEREDAITRLAETGWKPTDDRDAIRKVYKFKNFVEAFGWMAQGALIAEKMGHHPDWKNVWNRVEVELTTHEKGGLTSVDVKLAERFDKIAVPEQT